MYKSGGNHSVKMVISKNRCIIDAGEDVRSHHKSKSLNGPLNLQIKMTFMEKLEVGG